MATLKIARIDAVRRLFSVDDLAGGLDLRTSPTLLHPSRSRVCRNWSLSEPGALLVFPGWRTATSASLGPNRIQGAQRVYLAGHAPMTLVAYDGNVYRPTDGGTWGTAIANGLNATAPVFFPYDRDYVVALDGVTAPRKSVDGVTWTALGIAAPATAPTAALVAGGSLIVGSTYRFSYSGQDAALLAESNESPTVQIAIATAGTQTVRLTLPRHPDPQVDTLVIYAQNVTAGEPVRRRVGTVPNPTGATTTFDVTTANWGAEVEAPTDHGVPEPYAFATVWKNRWWARHATVPHRLHFTQVFEPQSWPATFFVDLPLERGDRITAIVPLGDTLLVFGQFSIYVIIGETSLDFSVRQSGASQSGALGPRACATVDDGVVHAAVDGVFLFNGATDQRLSTDIDRFHPTPVGWRLYVTTATEDELSATPVVYDAATKQISVGVTNLYPFGTPGEYVLDLPRTARQQAPAWTTTDRSIGGYLPYDGYEDIAANHSRLFSWPLAGGVLCEERVGMTADGADMVADYRGPIITAEPYQARYIDGFVSFEPNAGSFGLELVVDGVSMGADQVPISTGLSRYGTAVYGTDRYGSDTRQQVPLTFPLDAEGWSAEVRATYRGQAAFRWYTYRIAFVPEVTPRGM